MEHWQENPHSFGEILDLTFHFIKGNFAKLFLIMLIILGPFALILNLSLLSGTGFSFIGQPLNFNFENFLTQQSNLALNNLGVSSLVIYFLALFLRIVLASPIAAISLILATDYIKRNEDLNIKKIIKRAFSRYWPIMGGYSIFFLIVFGLYIALSIIAVIFVSITLTKLNIIIKIILGIIILGAALSAFIYFLTRWSFFFVAIVFEKVSPGLSKSFKLTKGSFWRLLGLYFVISILTTTITLVLSFGLELLLGVSILSTLLNTLLSFISTIIFIVAYTLVYFDLRIRNEATDLKQMIHDYNYDETVNEQKNDQEPENEL